MICKTKFVTANTNRWLVVVGFVVLIAHSSPTANAQFLRFGPLSGVSVRPPFVPPVPRPFARGPIVPVRPIPLPPFVPRPVARVVAPSPIAVARPIARIGVASAVATPNIVAVPLVPASLSFNYRSGPYGGASFQYQASAPYYSAPSHIEQTAYSASAGAREPYSSYATPPAATNLAPIGTLPNAGYVIPVPKAEAFAPQPPTRKQPAVAAVIRGSAEALKKSLSGMRADDAEVWLAYLEPDEVIKAVESNDVAKLAELLQNFDGVASNSDLSSVSNASGFADTRRALRSLVESRSNKADSPKQSQPVSASQDDASMQDTKSVLKPNTIPEDLPAPEALPAPLPEPDPASDGGEIQVPTPAAPIRSAE